MSRPVTTLSAVHERDLAELLADAVSNGLQIDRTCATCGREVEAAAEMGAIQRLGDRIAVFCERPACLLAGRQADA
jgi:hypothetical protein